jgi:hypothetical protein
MSVYPYDGPGIYSQIYNYPFDRSHGSNYHDIGSVRTVVSRSAVVNGGASKGKRSVSHSGRVVPVIHQSYVNPPPVQYRASQMLEMGSGRRIGGSRSTVTESEKRKTQSLGNFLMSKGYGHYNHRIVGHNKNYCM